MLFAVSATCTSVSLIWLRMNSKSCSTLRNASGRSCSDASADHAAETLAGQPTDGGGGDDRMDHLLQHHGVAADIPCRRQAYPGVHIADLFRFFEIAGAKFPRKQLRPMVQLLVARMIHNGFGCEEAGNFRRRRNLLVEQVERLRRAFRHDGQDAREVRIILSVETVELYALRIGCRVMHGMSPVRRANWGLAWFPSGKSS
ncbi:hypothetical protein WR25_18016 [Diploscapter pachys]|uniref:Uncharacterized protein n=1 Tax=Diploscapter pachys TaxID=2018661 RepID=A0A2A2K178_9BILA|nr:hypothetical protein WR25_18016 [Diploscapter pachys]